MPRFNPNVRYQIRQEGGRYVVINVDRNRRMNKTHATRREAQAHINQTKRRVSQIIGYHNRAPAAAQRNNRRAPPPANRRPVANVGRRADARRRGRPRGARNRNAGGPSNAPATPPRRNNQQARQLQRANTVTRPRRRREATPVARRRRPRRATKAPERLNL